MAASSLSPSPSNSYYDVFLSFRGADTRKNFADHLYTALVDAGISIFRDDNDLPRGENIDSELKRAIHDSKCSVIVFSKDYASSESCLYELMTILEHKKTSNHMVLPVFYDVDPSHVSDQTGSFMEAFSKHENQFKEDMDKVNQWREGLKEAADLAGMNLQNKHEAEFVKEIVNEVEMKLRHTPLCVTPDLVGIYYQLEKINHWVSDGSSDDMILLICGIPGIGKTTIAKCVYNSNFMSFEGSAFLENVSVISRQPDGIVNLQSKLLSYLTKRDVTIRDPNEGTRKIQAVICSKKVILVLDDVDDVRTLDKIIGMRYLFYPGSKIIITTIEHAKLLTTRGAYSVHEVEKLARTSSLQLFCRHAFGQDHPKKDFKQVSERIADHCEGHPLALEILGRASLDWKSTDLWEKAIEALKLIPDGEILNKLKISFDTIQYDHVKNLLLDIACFFIGEDEDFIVALLDGCEGFHPKYGIQTLTSRCLITINMENRVGMHNLIRDMGREIVRQESPNEPGRRSRLWKAKDSYDVLTKKTGKRTVEGIVLDKCNGSSDKVVLEENTFAKMVNLRLLIVSGDRGLSGSYDSFPKLQRWFSTGSYKSFPKGLRLLRWRGFALHYIPDDVVLESLVVFEMPHSKLRQVWKASKCLPQLKVLDLSCSQEFTSTPDFSLLPKLERLILKGCAGLVSVHESIVNLEKLHTLDISGCSNLTKFPLMGLRTMRALKVFSADGSPMNRWLGYIEKVKSLHNPWPESLVELCLSNCNLSNDDFPKDFKNLSSLTLLDLEENHIDRLPDCIRDLTGLDYLSLNRCYKLQSVVDLPPIRKHLGVTECHSLKKITFKSAWTKPHPYHGIDDDHCIDLVEYGNWFKVEPFGSIDVEMINIFGLENLESLQDIDINIASYYWNRRLPIQGIREHGIYNIFLPGNEIPSTFNHKSRDLSISLSLPILAIQKIQGLNVSIVYAVHKKPECIWDLGNISIKVYNKSKGLEWIYMPSFWGYHLDNGKDMIWLSYWKLQNYLDSGDEVIVSISLSYPDRIKFKEFGIQVVYEQEEMTSIQLEDNIDYPSDIGSICECWPDYFQEEQGKYFFSGPPIRLFYY